MPRNTTDPASTSTVQSVDRAFAILDLVAAGSSSLADITAQVDLPKSTVARLLGTLESLKAVERDGGDYGIGPRLSALVGREQSWARLRTLVLPHLRRLAEQLGEATGLAVPDGDAVRYVLQVDSPTPVQVRDWTDLVNPMHIGSPGLAMMARWDQERVDAYLARPLERHTATTVVDADQIRARLVAIRRDGYSVVVDEFADGIASVAACVLGANGQVLGTIHAHGPSYRFPPDGMADDVGRVIATTARSILPHPAA